MQDPIFLLDPNEPEESTVTLLRTAIMTHYGDRITKQRKRKKKS